MVRFTPTVDGVDIEHLQGGFFEGWRTKPSPETHLRLLQENADYFLGLYEFF